MVAMEMGMLLGVIEMYVCVTNGKVRMCGEGSV